MIAQLHQLLLELIPVRTPTPGVRSSPPPDVKERLLAGYDSASGLPGSIAQPDSREHMDAPSYLVDEGGFLGLVDPLEVAPARTASTTRTPRRRGVQVSVRVGPGR
jgi:hypothetical protein